MLQETHEEWSRGTCCIGISFIYLLFLFVFFGLGGEEGNRGHGLHTDLDWMYLHRHLHVDTHTFVQRKQQFKNSPEKHITRQHLFRKSVLDFDLTRYEIKCVPYDNFLLFLGFICLYWCSLKSLSRKQ